MPPDPRYESALKYISGRLDADPSLAIEDLEHQVGKASNIVSTNNPGMDPADARMSVLRDVDERRGSEHAPQEAFLRRMTPEREEDFRKEFVLTPGEIVPRVAVEGYTVERFFDKVKTGDAPEFHELEEMTARGIFVAPEVFDLAAQPIFHKEARRRTHHNLGYAAAEGAKEDK